MVVWLKPCESRSSLGIYPKTPYSNVRGFSLGEGKLQSKSEE